MKGLILITIYAKLSLDFFLGGGHTQYAQDFALFCVLGRSQDKGSAYHIINVSHVQG